MSTSSRHNTANRVTPRGPKRARIEADESDGASGRNRHRITRACNECRRRKDRCGGQRPSCTSCIESSRVCSYGPSKKRGLRPGYVRAIEVLLGLVFTTVEGSESYVHGLLQGQIQQTSVRRQGAGIKDSDISAEFLLEAWRKGSVAKEVGKLLSPEGVEDEDDGTDSTQYFDTKISEALALFLSTTGGETGAPLTPMNTDTTPQDVMAFDTLTTPVAVLPTSSFTEASPQISISHPPEPTTSHGMRCSSSSISELPQNWPVLLDLYFETTHSWFPISQKHELLRAAYKLANSTSITSVDLPSTGDIAFLQAVLLFASHQSTFISDSFKSAHNGTHDETYNIRSSQDLGRTSLFADPSMYELGHVRAFLVLALFDMDQKLWSAAWVNIGRAVYTATSTGLVDKNSTTGSSNCDDNVKRTLLGCAALETIISARLNTIPFFHSSDILCTGLLTIDGMEEWEPWQPKILSSTTTMNQQGPSSHMPGHVISTFNRLLQVIASLNELTCQKRNPLTEGTLLKIIRECEQDLGGLSDIAITANLSPQTLSLWMASIATLETAAAALLVSNGMSHERPGRYLSSVTTLVGLIEKRVQSIGRCSVPPVVEACLVLLQQALVRQPQLYVGTDVELDFNLLKETLAGYMGSVQEPLDRDMQLDTTYDPGSNSVNTARNLLELIQPIAANTYIPSRKSITSGIPSANLNLDTLLGAMDSTMSQDETPIHTSQSPGLTKDVAFEPLSASLGDDMGDDGLFDSLAMLDSTEWLANPPEFMQHLGLLEKPLNEFENIFDTRF